MFTLQTATLYRVYRLFPLKCFCFGCWFKNGDRINVAVKTCKDCSPDVMEKFMSEAGNLEKCV